MSAQNKNDAINAWIMMALMRNHAVAARVHRDPWHDAVVQRMPSTLRRRR
jgi:cytochrome b561